MGRKFIHQWAMLAKKQSVCTETGKQIEVGDKILFVPLAKSLVKSGIQPNVYCEESKQYKKATTQEIHITGFKDGL